MHGIEWAEAELGEVNELLRLAHYLGPLKSGGRFLFGGWSPAGELVAAQVWRPPTSRHLPHDGSWLELSRWCLTPEAGPYAGSRMHKKVAATLRLRYPQVTTLISYSDASQGHTGALYRACNWYWAPTWLRLRPPPTGNGNWGKDKVQHPKDRWVFDVRPDERRAAILNPDDKPAIRKYLGTEEWRTVTYRWGSNLDLLVPQPTHAETCDMDEDCTCGVAA